MEKLIWELEQQTEWCKERLQDAMDREFTEKMTYLNGQIAGLKKAIQLIELNK
tara:strand:+ start:175 stop:333 length:159 start_codon:yes stop_codon:yes gene_type:complete